MIQPQNMLRLEQLVLQQVSDNKDLFRKELIKSIKRLQSSEIVKLHCWLRENYQATHKKIIEEVFSFTDSEVFYS